MRPLCPFRIDLCLIEQLLQVQKKFAWVLVALFLLAAVFAAREAAGASLSELINKAKQEGALNATVEHMKGRTTQELAAAFNKRFRVDIRVTLSPVSDAPTYAQAIAETQVGGVASYDAVHGSGPNNMSLMGAGGLHKVDNWESVLKEIDPLVRDGKVRPEQVSFPPFTGYAFEHGVRVKAILYNPRLISVADVPKNHVELVDPKYKGKWTQPPWTTQWDIGPFVFPEMAKQKWLEVVRNAGKNAGAVLPYASGTQRVLLGEFAFAIGDSLYAFQAKAADPQAPVEIVFFKDYNQVIGTFYGVRKGARHPAAATLFALWMGTPEAQSIWQPDIFLPNYNWGQSELDRSLRESVRKAKANLVDLVSTKEGRDFLAWYGTPEGRQYRQAIGKAIKGE